jgi:hypothetical protein
MAAKTFISKPIGFLLALAAGVLVVFVTNAIGQAAQLREIDNLERDADRFSRLNKRRAIAIADIAEYDAPRREWKRFESPEKMEKFAQENIVYTASLNWVQGKKIRITSITYSSPSGDWARYVKYVFYSDGQTAKITDEMRTFYGDCILRTSIYLSRGGRILKRQSRSYDLITNKPRQSKCDSGTETAVFHNAFELPFYKLIIRK